MIITDAEQRVLDHKMEQAELEREAQERKAIRDHEMQLAKLQHRVVERNLTVRSVSYDIFTIIPKCVIAMCITLLVLFRREVPQVFVKMFVK